MRAAHLVYDIGMYHGEDAAYYLKRGFRVIGIEADPEHAAYCRARFANEIAQDRLILLEGAIAPPFTQSVAFYKNIENPVWGSIDPMWVERNERRGTRHQLIFVARVDLDECFTRYGMPYFMKIDIEGADMLCVHALENHIVRPAYLSLESDMKSLARLETEIRLLETLGYNAFRAVQQSNLPARTRDLALPDGVTHTFAYGCSGPLPEEFPAPWQSAREIRRTYRKIFLLYQHLGTESWLWRTQFGRAWIRALGKRVQGEVPGWYDTHARHAAATV